MIISHKNKYLFLCLPRTGTTAIRKELCANYDGEEILYKHAPYSQFLKIASNEEKEYKIIATIRNPLDRTLSLYFKYKSNHDSINDKQIKNIGNKNFIQRFLIGIANKILGKRAQSVASGSMNFPEFIKNYFNTPYCDWHSLYLKEYDYIIHFENMNEDFTKTLTSIGLDVVRDIPYTNKTKKDEDVSIEKYYTSEIIPLVQKNYYYAMKLYGYSFPKTWPEYQPTIFDKIKYILYCSIKQMYWKYIR
ncbi:MAG: sulfotransferase family 2 domain-containing protein [Chitinophagales bacterium]